MKKLSDADYGKHQWSRIQNTGINKIYNSHVYIFFDFQMIFKFVNDCSGKWRAPLIDNPNYQGKWAPRRIPNPDFFEDLMPFKMTPIVSIFLKI